MRLSGAALVICLLVASASAADAQGTPASAAELARGKYVFGATGGCGCHTVPKGPSYRRPPLLTGCLGWV